MSGIPPRPPRRIIRQYVRPRNISQPLAPPPPPLAPTPAPLPPSIPSLDLSKYNNDTIERLILQGTQINDWSQINEWVNKAVGTLQYPLQSADTLVPQDVLSKKGNYPSIGNSQIYEAGYSGAQGSVTFNGNHSIGLKNKTIHFRGNLDCLILSFLSCTSSTLRRLPTNQHRDVIASLFRRGVLPIWYPNGLSEEDATLSRITGTNDLAAVSGSIIAARLHLNLLVATPSTYVDSSMPTRTGIMPYRIFNQAILTNPAYDSFICIYGQPGHFQPVKFVMNGIEPNYIVRVSQGFNYKEFEITPTIGCKYDEFDKVFYKCVPYWIVSRYSNDEECIHYILLKMGSEYDDIFLKGKPLPPKQGQSSLPIIYKGVEIRNKHGDWTAEFKGMVGTGAEHFLPGKFIKVNPNEVFPYTQEGMDQCARAGSNAARAGSNAANETSGEEVVEEIIEINNTNTNNNNMKRAIQASLVEAALQKTNKNMLEQAMQNSLKFQRRTGTGHIITMEATKTGVKEIDDLIQTYVNTLKSEEGNEKNDYKTTEQLTETLFRRLNSDKRKRRVHKNRRTQRKRLNKNRSTRRRK